MSAYDFMIDCWYCNLSYSAYVEMAQLEGYMVHSRDEYNELNNVLA